MLCVGLIHGDLPQVVNAAGNNNAFATLERDIGSITETLGHFVPAFWQPISQRKCGRWSCRARSSPTAN
jgi:serine/threonine-protein kinase RIO1